MCFLSVELFRVLFRSACVRERVSVPPNNSVSAGPLLANNVISMQSNIFNNNIFLSRCSSATSVCISKRSGGKKGSF